MTVHALINPQGAIDRQQSNIDPAVQTKPGWKWLPVESAAQPATTALETASSAYVVGANAVTQEWTVVRRSLDAQKAAVKAEAQRRIIAVTGTSDLMACVIKQSNANMRANDLNDKRLNGETLTEGEAGEAAALRNLAIAIKGIRAKSNDIEAMDPIPLDYTADSYWTA
jgi:hypothetical protein